MKTLRYYLTISLLLMTTLAMAQITRVSGTVSDDFDVLPGVNVVEVDASNRMVNATVTDMNGNFVLAIKSQSNKIRFSYMGYQQHRVLITSQQVNAFWLVRHRHLQGVTHLWCTLFTTFGSNLNNAICAL